MNTRKLAASLMALYLLSACAGPAATADDAHETGQESPSAYIQLEDSDILPVEGSPIRGAEDAWVTLLVFADFQCPFCARMAAVLDDVTDSFEDGLIRIVFKHYPLDSHPAARPAALAAEAAREQGKFWEMHDALFDSFASLRTGDPRQRLMELAAELELDLDQFSADMDDERLAARVDRDRELAEELGLRGVPALFVNGGFIAGVQDADYYQQAIVNMLRILHQGVESGDLERQEVYRRSVQSLFAHTRPQRQRAAPTPEAVMAVPVDDGRPHTGDADEALVHIAIFASLGADPSLQLLQRLTREIAEAGGDLRISYFHLPHQLDDASLLAHRALQGARAGAEVQELVAWLSDPENLWRQDLGLLQDFLDESQIQPVDPDTFDTALEADIEAAAAFEIYGTPTFFINGIRLVGLPEGQELERILAEQEALAAHVSQVMNISGRALYDTMVNSNRERYVEEP